MQHLSLQITRSPTTSIRFRVLCEPEFNESQCGSILAQLMQITEKAAFFQGLTDISTKGKLPPSFPEPCADTGPWGEPEK